MVRRRQNRANQETIEAILPPSLAGTRNIDAPSPMPDLIARNPRIPFGQVVMPYFFKMNPRQYTDVTYAGLRAIKAEKIAPFLHGTRSVQSVDGIVLPSIEFGAVLRSPRAYQGQIEAKEFERSGMDPDIGRRTERAQEKARQGLAGRLADMGLVRGVIQQEQDTTHRLQAEARSPGYAHVRFSNMLQMVTATRELYFKQILEVAGREKGWTRPQHRMAGRALDVSLFMSGNERVNNFRGWLEMEVDWVDDRAGLLDNRMKMVSGMLGIPSEASPGLELIDRAS